MKLRQLLLLGTIAMLVTTSCDESSNNLTSDEIAMQIEGSWSVNESSSIFKSTMQGYSVYISPDNNDPTLINIERFYGLGDNVFAIGRVTGYNIRLTPNQVLPDGYTIVNGNGVINKNLKEIVWTYSIDDGSGDVDLVEATYTFSY